MEVRKIIPPSGDIREWIIGQREAGKTRDDIARELIAMRDRSEVYTPARAKEEEQTADDAMLAELGLDVIGEYEDGSVEVFCTTTRKFTRIRDIERIKMARLAQICTKAVVKAKVHRGSESRAGMMQLEEVRMLIADAAGRRPKLVDDSKREAGCWESGRNVVLVGDGWKSIWNGEHLICDAMPRCDGRLYDLAGNPNWFCTSRDCDNCQFRRLIENGNQKSDEQAVLDALGLLRRWRYQFHKGAELALGLILATWVQKFWDWRPQVAITGETVSGKTIFFRMLKRMFCGLAESASRKTTAIGIMKHCRSSAKIAVMDELDKNPHREDIIETVVRPAGRGEDERWTGEGRGRSEKALSQIFWLAGIESGLTTKTDADRFVRIELLPKAPGSPTIIQPTQTECEAVGLKLLATSVRLVRDAVTLAGEIGGLELDGFSNRVTETYSVPAAMFALAIGVSGESVLRDFVKNSEVMTREVVADAEDLFETLRSSHVDAGRELGRLSVEQLIEIVRDGYSSQRTDAEKALDKCGLVVVGDGVRVNTTRVKRHLLAKTRWNRSSIAEIMQRVPGAEAQRTKHRRFWWTPIDLFLDEDEENEELF